jgi:probable rRNA maturation factor
LNIQVREPRPPLTGWLDDQLQRIAVGAGVRHGAVNIAVVDDAQMSRLHDRFLGDPRTTDVLTFDLRDDAAQPWQPGEPLEGDLAICLDQASREAAARGHATRDEVLLYAVHGLLHLMGMTDDTPAPAAAMHRKEDELLASVGIGPIYRGRRGPARPARD